MSFRNMNIRNFFIWIVLAAVVYLILIRFHTPKSNPIIIQQVTRVDTSSAKEKTSTFNDPPKVLVNSPLHDELIQIKFRSMRISPSEMTQTFPERVRNPEVLKYDEDAFRTSSIPILWLDAQKDVRWNTAAERAMLSYLTAKQFPSLEKFEQGSMKREEIIELCQPKNMFVLHQHWSGFFSRVLCFIAQVGQTLYSPRMAVLRGSRFSGGKGDSDDFLSQGVVRYFLPISICSAYEFRHDLADLKRIIEQAPNGINLLRSTELLSHGASTENRVLLSTEFWKPDYHHVPIRKWLFDRKNSSVGYDSPISVLTDHSSEHIYGFNDEKNVEITDWVDRNRPDAFSSDLLVTTGDRKLTWQDHMFGSFLRYMFVLYFGSQNAPRVEFGTRILAQHWSSYLHDKYALPPEKNVFENLAGLYIRRGDKMSEDSFWHKHQHWRNLSYYVKGIVDEEERSKRKFQYIFVMTDDSYVMNSLKEYADGNSKGTDEAYARQHLRGREILHNILAPQSCFDPFHRVGFDQFLVSMRFLIDNAAFTIGHTDSNVYRFFREVVYALRQHQAGVQTFTYVRNAPDTF